MLQERLDATHQECAMRDLILAVPGLFQEAQDGFRAFFRSALEKQMWSFDDRVSGFRHDGMDLSCTSTPYQPIPLCLKVEQWRLNQGQ